MTKLAESPPPMIVVAPFFVALIILLRISSLPFLNYGTSKNPIGPFQNTEPAFEITSSYNFADSGPTSNISYSAGISSLYFITLTLDTFLVLFT